MLGDVGDPQDVGLDDGELTIDQVGHARSVGSGTPAPLGGQSPEPRTLHQHRHSVVADRDDPTNPELGMNTRCPIRAARGGVDLADPIGEPGMADRASRGRAATRRVVARPRDLE